MFRSANSRVIQREAVRAAISEERGQLVHQVMEGRTGEMEALWRQKELTRDGILAAETTRKRLLDELLVRYAEVLEE